MIGPRAAPPLSLALLSIIIYVYKLYRMRLIAIVHKLCFITFAFSSFGISYKLIRSFVFNIICFQILT